MYPNLHKNLRVQVSCNQSMSIFYFNKKKDYLTIVYKLSIHIFKQYKCINYKHQINKAENFIEITILFFKLISINISTLLIVFYLFFLFFPI